MNDKIVCIQGIVLKEFFYELLPVNIWFICLFYISEHLELHKIFSDKEMMSNRKGLRSFALAPVW